MHIMLHIFHTYFRVVYSVQENWRFQRVLRGESEFVPSSFCFVRKIFVCTVPPGTVLIPTKFKFNVPNLWRLVVFCTCRVLPKALTFVKTEIEHHVSDKPHKCFEFEIHTNTKFTWRICLASMSWAVACFMNCTSSHVLLPSSCIFSILESVASLNLLSSSRDLAWLVKRSK